VKPDAEAAGSKDETDAVAVAAFAAEEATPLAVSGTDPVKTAPDVEEAPEMTSE